MSDAIVLYKPEVHVELHRWAITATIGGQGMLWPGGSLLTYDGAHYVHHQIVPPAVAVRTLDLHAASVESMPPELSCLPLDEPAPRASGVATEFVGAARLPNVAARGVYYLPWMGTAGEIYLVAVDHAGHKVNEATVYPGQDAERIKLELWDELDQERPRLQLIR